MKIEDGVLASRIEEVLGGMFVAIRELKSQGVGRPQAILVPSERAFLTQSLSRLSDWVVEELWRKALDDATFAARGTSRGSIGSFRNQWRLIGKETGLFEILASKTDGDAARYFLAQMLVAETRHWRDPLDCLFFAACQNAVHKAVRAEFGRTEPQYTRAFLRFLPEIVKEGIVEPFGELGSDLPEEFHLQFATASMEGPGNKDLQGADLAIVVGTLLYDRPVWRVVLLQAKSERARGKSSAGYKRGAQLAEILSTGMGAYLFYPKVVSERIFIPTVRIAEDVFADIHRSRSSSCRASLRRTGIHFAKKHSIETRWVNIDPCGGVEGPAWDLASFIALEMRRPRSFGPGRVFPSVKAVADALSIGRERPIEGLSGRPRNLLIASTSPRLDVLEFQPIIHADYASWSFSGLPRLSEPRPGPRGRRTGSGRLGGRA
jgi:hypothetical protein